MTRVSFFLISIILLTGSVTSFAQQQQIGAQIFQKIRAGELDTALAMAQQALKKHPDDPQLHHLLGRIYFKKGLYSESIAALQHSLDLKPKARWLIAWNYVYLGFNHQKLGERNKAIDYLKKSVDLKATRNSIRAAIKALKEMGVEYGAEALAEVEKYPKSLEGQSAPDFTLRDVYGLSHRLSDHKGMVVFLHIGPSW